MNYENMRKWIEALRSGLYTQITGVLHTKEGESCALGVLCEVAMENGVVLNRQFKEETNIYIKSKSRYATRRTASYNGNHTYVPRPVLDWLGISPNTVYDPKKFTVSANQHSTGYDISVAPSTLMGGGFRSVSGANDGGKNFKEIANMIEDAIAATPPSPPSPPRGCF